METNVKIDGYTITFPFSGINKTLLGYNDITSIQTKNNKGGNFTSITSDSIPINTLNDQHLNDSSKIILKRINIFQQILTGVNV